MQDVLWLDWDLEKLKDLPKLPQEGGNIGNIEMRNFAYFPHALVKERWCRLARMLIFLLS